MTRRRWIACFGIALGSFAACTFPDVSFAPEGATTSGEAGADARPEADPPPEFLPDANVDATVVPEGGGHVTEAGCGANPCDCDGDQVNNSSSGCSHEAGVDCDDFNRYINPAATWTASPWDPLSQHTPAGDWNCDNNREKLLPTNIKCDQTSSKAACEQQGFSGDPECGTESDYVFCSYTAGIGPILASCSVGKTEKRTQSCR